MQIDRLTPEQEQQLFNALAVWLKEQAKDIEKQCTYGMPLWMTHK